MCTCGGLPLGLAFSFPCNACPSKVGRRSSSSRPPRSERSSAGPRRGRGERRQPRTCNRWTSLPWPRSPPS
uniref:Putative secreted protein n=1 Tax=Ixodes ricinus TaxID=34613 RepID=A0A6B0TXI0_IXORI